MAADELRLEQLPEAGRVERAAVEDRLARRRRCIDRATGEWLGQAGPWQPEGWPGTEVGWSFKRSAWGRGYASEAAAATIDWAFDHLGWTEVIHTIGPANVASQALARRLGSTLLGPGRLPDPYAEVPVEIWGQSREQWRARRAANREP